MDETAQASLARLDEITRRLRVECPWDREQDERSIVPHTVEEAYELADAAIDGDDDKLVDELGDVLFQVYFLSLLLEERGAGDLAAVAERMIAKLIRRHPHVFGNVEVDSADGVVRNWDAIKRDESGSIFGDLPENLPATLYARKIQRRAANAGVAPQADASVGPAADRAGARAADPVAAETLATDSLAVPAADPLAEPAADPLAEPAADPLAEPAADSPAADSPAADSPAADSPAAETHSEPPFDLIGRRLFELVAEARQLHVDPELALRTYARRFMEGASE